MLCRHIPFESRECARGGHASYAYFTMDCMAAKISGVGCGDDMFGAAPDGFRYKWYPRKIVDGLSGENSVRVLQAYFDNPDFSDTLKTFTPPVLAPDDIAEGDGIYVCRIISKEDEDCWFELQADLDPRDVYADASLDSVVYNNGEARAYFTNKSYTKTRYRDETGRCDYFQWDAGTGKIITEENPTIVLPPGKHNIRLSAYLEGAMEGNACVDTWDTTITIPANPDESATITPATTTCTFSPNPIKAGQSATITLPDHIDLDNSTIEIINSAGQPITTHTLSSYALSTSTSHISIPHSAFPTPGLYMLRITTPDRTTYTGKLLVE